MACLVRRDALQAGVLPGLERPVPRRACFKRNRGCRAEAKVSVGSPGRELVRGKELAEVADESRDTATLPEASQCASRAGLREEVDVPPGVSVGEHPYPRAAR